MLTKLPPAALTALSLFVETPRWAHFDEWLQAEIEAVTLRLIGAREDADAHELRGRLATLRDFRQTALDARATLAKQGLRVPLS